MNSPNTDEYLSLTERISTQIPSFLKPKQFLKNIDGKLKYTYLFLLTLLMGCLGIGLTLQTRTSWLRDFALDIASEIIGILLVIFSVDRVIDAERKKRTKKKEFVAIQQIRNAFSKHIRALFKITNHHPENSEESNLLLFESTSNDSLNQMIS
ncbi:MAG: DUF1097 domain-containing protein, partial [Cyanobacteria bacterium P01_G01_bin.49]